DLREVEVPLQDHRDPERRPAAAIPPPVVPATIAEAARAAPVGPPGDVQPEADRHVVVDRGDRTVVEERDVGADPEPGAMSRPRPGPDAVGLQLEVVLRVLTWALDDVRGVCVRRVREG